jgi:outer membrane protein OmpA-like peptidoglycan-associated protein
MKTTTLLLAASLVFTSCQTTNPYTGERQTSKAVSGAVIGSLVGAGIGALTGDNSSEKKQRALVGAGLGALAGGGYGAYMDQQEAELRRELQGTGVSVSRAGNQIILNMPGDVTFATGSANINAQHYATLNSVGKVLNKFNRTRVDIGGHTDNVGTANFNYSLSQNRAASVGNYLIGQRVDARRFNMRGYGKDYPIASNDTPEGRQVNRRVTIQLAPQG